MSLLAPLFLAGLLAVGLPWWLHRLSSENPNRKPFSSLMFLEAGEPQRVLAKNVQYLLLLALRVGLLVLLALAFAQPTLFRSPEAAAADGARLHVIALDASASMAYGSRWSDAQDAARDIIDSLASDDRGQVVLAGRTTELLTGATLDRAELRQAVVAAQPGVFYLEFGQLTRALDGVVGASELPVVAHIVTDAQATGLPVRFAELAPRARMELRIHSLTADTEDNWALDLLTGSALTGELTAGVQSFAQRSAQKLVQLELNGQVVEQQSLSVPAGGRAEASFAALELAEGSNRVTVSLSPSDDLEADDSRFIALQKPEPRPVLLVSGDLRGRDTLFVASAMGSLTQLALQVTTASPPDLAEQTLSDFHFVVLADAGAIDDDEIERLADYVESGGAVLQALSARSTGLPNVPLTGHIFGAGGVNLGRGIQDYAAVGAVDLDHPALRGIGSLRGARFFRHTAVQALPEDAVLMSLDNGAPLLIESELGSGRVLLFTSSLDREWNDLAVQPVFVPLIAGLANHMLGGAGFSNVAELGSTLALRAMGLQGGQIFDPAGDPALGLGGGTDDVLLDQIGFYELVSGGRAELVAVNFDARESNLAPIDAATIERWQGLGSRSADLEPGAAPTTMAEVVPLPLGQWILLLLLVAVIVESWVGNWHLRVRRGIAA